MNHSKSIKTDYLYVCGRTFLHTRGVRGFAYYGKLSSPNRFGLLHWKGKNRETAREAAIDVDKHLMANGIEPINIFKRKP